MVQGIIAGGYDATYRAVEASEDDRQAGAHDLDERGVKGTDAIVGIAAYGGIDPIPVGCRDALVERADRCLGEAVVETLDSLRREGEPEQDDTR